MCIETVSNTVLKKLAIYISLSQSHRQNGFNSHEQASYTTTKMKKLLNYLFHSHKVSFYIEVFQNSVSIIILRLECILILRCFL